MERMSHFRKSQIIRMHFKDNPKLKSSKGKKAAVKKSKTAKLYVALRYEGGSRQWIVDQKPTFSRADLDLMRNVYNLYHVLSVEVPTTYEDCMEEAVRERKRRVRATKRAEKREVERRKKK